MDEANCDLSIIFAIAFSADIAKDEAKYSVEEWRKLEDLASCACSMYRFAKEIIPFDERDNEKQTVLDNWASSVEAITGDRWDYPAMHKLAQSRVEKTFPFLFNPCAIKEEE